MPPIHGNVDSHASNPQEGASDDLSIRGGGATTTGGPTPLSRSDPVLRFVRSRQTFVRRGHEWKKAPAEWTAGAS